MSHIQRALKADLLRDREKAPAKMCILLKMVLNLHVYSCNVFAQLIACYLHYIKMHYSLYVY